jgi:hypothetical protein
MTISMNPGNRRRADTDESITPDKQDDWRLSDQTSMSRKLIMMPHMQKSNDAGRVLNNGIMCENKKVQSLKLEWIRWLLSRCRGFMREKIGDLIWDKAFDVGLRAKGVLLDKGDVDWNNPNMRLKDMREYTDAVTTNDSDDLLQA